MRAFGESLFGKKLRKNSDIIFGSFQGDVGFFARLRLPKKIPAIRFCIARVQNPKSKAQLSKKALSQLTFYTNNSTFTCNTIANWLRFKSSPFLNLNRLLFQLSLGKFFGGVEPFSKERFHVASPDKHQFVNYVHHNRKQLYILTKISKTLDLLIFLC